MNQFLAVEADALAAMIDQHDGTCTLFRNETMPRECSPGQANVGFEKDLTTGHLRLLVARGVHYTGENQALQNWFNTGVAEFQDANHLVQWLHTELAPAMNSITPNVETPEHVEEDKPVFYDRNEFHQAMQAAVKGQDDALQTLVSSVRIHAAQKSPRRPLTLFAIGPTGVGKTKCGLALAKAMNQLQPRRKKYEFLRIDMCEYREAHRVSQLLGSPQGYVGYKDGAQLSDALARNPRTIILFDEIEKAHPDILKVLMNAMDAGRLSRAVRDEQNGHEIDCRKTIFFFSSNIRSEALLHALDMPTSETQKDVDAVCREQLSQAGIPPELVGRISHFLVFKPLGTETIAEIVNLEIQDVAGEFGLQVCEITPEIISDVIDSTHARGLGARTYAYQCKRMLGDLFFQAAQAGVSTPIKIIGPIPYRYELLQSETLHPQGTPQ